MRLKPYESLIVLNLIAYTLLRVGLGAEGFNFAGLEALAKHFVEPVFLCLWLWWLYRTYNLVRGRSGGIVKSIPAREYAFVLLMFFSYWSFSGLGADGKVDLIHQVNGHDMDAILIRADQSILGFQPVQALQAVIHPLLTFVLLESYIIAYLPLMILLMYVLHARGDEKEMERFMTALVVAYTVARIIYFIVPAVGPETTLEYASDLGLCPSQMESLYGPVRDIDSTLRNTFPSLHIALSAIFLLNMRALRRWEKALVTSIVVMMWFSTLYLRMHYFVDVMAGWGLAAFSAWISPKLMSIGLKPSD